MSLTFAKHCKKTLTASLIIGIAIISVFSTALLLFAKNNINLSENTINMNNSFSVTIPKFISCRKANYVVSDEISEHFILEGTDKAKGINGYIQVWNMTKPITDYIDMVENSLSSSVFDYEKSPLLPMNGSNGYNLSFYINNESYNTHVLQSLWHQGDKMYVLSLSAPSDLPAYDSLNSVFEEIKSSVVFT